MKTDNHNHIVTLLRQLAFITILCTMVAQPLMQTIVLLGNFNYELADFEKGEGSDDEEKQEDDSKDKKIELQIVSPSTHRYIYDDTTLDYLKQNFKWNFSLEIPIPPPEQV